MNDLVSEYQQYQDATAEGKSDIEHRFHRNWWSLFRISEEGEAGEEEDERV